MSEKLKDMQRRSGLPEQKNAAAQAQRQHVNVVIRDHRADSLAQGIAEENHIVTNTTSRWDRATLKFDVGWMDQANFRCPRNTSMNKQIADMWRPQLGPGGVTMDGIGSFVFLTDLFLGKH